VVYLAIDRLRLRWAGRRNTKRQNAAPEGIGA
jgi:hypothetical protein